MLNNTFRNVISFKVNTTVDPNDFCVFFFNSIFFPGAAGRLSHDHLGGSDHFFYSFAILLRVMLTSVDISEKAWDIEFLIVF